MISKFAQFYFTKEDPDYSIKGSRDPLGFQVLWQNQGRKLIPFLSTVSSNLHDFQIMCLAYYFYGKEPDNHFVRFFIRFEQLMGYVRYDPSNVQGFNGIDGVKRKLNESSRISISSNTEDQILSNQRAYGIWGKYNRPFQDIRFTKQPEFESVFDEKISHLTDITNALRILDKILNRDQSKFSQEEISCLLPLLSYTPGELEFYKRNILLVQHENALQNKLFDFVSNTSLPDKLHLYTFLHSFSNSLGQRNDQLKALIEEIKNTERVLCPLNRIFRYLQTKPHWERDEIMEDPYIKRCKINVNYVFHGGTEQAKIKNNLVHILHEDSWILVNSLVQRNMEVSSWREGTAWISATKNILEVHHSDGGYQQPGFDPEVDFDNGYFIDTYLSLYRQSLTQA